MRDGQDLKQYKVWLDEQRNLKKFMLWARSRIPDRVKMITNSSACFYTTSEDGDYKYKTGSDGVHYCYEVSGTGFKYMPAHGKIIYDALITGKDKSFVAPTKAKL